MFIGEVLKAGTNLSKGPRKDQETPHVTVYIFTHIYIYIYIYIQMSLCLSSHPIYPKCVVQSNVVTTKRCYFVDG